MVTPVRTPDEFMSLGLMMGGYDEERATRKSNMDRFKSIYGLLPHVFAHLWEDLMATLSTYDERPAALLLLLLVVATVAKRPHHNIGTIMVAEPR
eukprot:scaffold420211_cov47-Attheya_sp.AAC.1